MTLIWCPSLDPAAARWQAQARELPADAGTRLSPAEARECGLLKMFRPRPQAGLTASVSAVVAAVEALSGSSTQRAALLAAVLAGAAPVLQLGSNQQKKAWLGQLGDGDTLPPLLVGSDDDTAGDAGFSAIPDAQAWALRGTGRAPAACELAGAFVVFAAQPRERGPAQLSAFIVPRDTAGIDIGNEDGYDIAGERLTLDARLPSSRLLGAAGSAGAALACSAAWRRIAAAAQATGLCLAAYEQACRVVQLEDSGATPSHAAITLASCATAISAARMMLYEAARATDKGEDILLLSAMAMLSANECADRVMAATVQIAGGHPAADAARMQALLRARRMQQAAAGANASQAQTALLAGAIAPSSHTTKGGMRAMRKSPSTPTPASAATATARTSETHGRVSEILDAAANAFTQQSYDATTLDYIGDVIGVTKGSIYYHYRSKADLFVAVYRRAMEMNIETITPIAQQQGARAIDRLYRMAYAHSLQVMKHLSYQRLAVQGLEAQLMDRVTDEQRAQLKEVIGLRDHYEKLFVQVITQAIDAGDLPQQSPRLAVKPLFGAINGTTMWYQPRAGETAADRERIASQLAGFVVSGLMQTYRPLADTGSKVARETG
ncbi:TetR family transcriptional regulator [Cupriavidus sp. 2TAF22]|uniref:TetR family transcriptional regulator n=1 Tax=Cupriavidus sp. 2TAF22 TaxID=3233010 RepID=UPI003F90F953